jgi:sodium-independent sulfate anion transporter 11
MLSAKRIGNRIVGNPEQTVTTISTETYLKGLVKDPRHEVRNPYTFLQCSIRIVLFQAVNYLTSLFPILGWITRYSEIFHFSC